MKEVIVTHHSHLNNYGLSLLRGDLVGFRSCMLYSLEQDSGFVLRLLDGWSFLPETNGQNLGSSSKRWQVYAADIDISGDITIKDDKKIYFGTSKDASIQWDSSNSRLSINTLAEYTYYGSWMNNTVSHNFNYRRGYFNSNNGVVSGDNKMIYNYLVLSGNHDFTGTQACVYNYVADWAEAKVTHLYGDYCVVCHLLGDVHWAWGGLFEVQAHSASSSSHMDYGVGGDFRASTGGASYQTVSNLYGGRFSVSSQGHGDVTTMVGADMTLCVKGSGNVSYGYGIKIHNASVTGTGSLNKFYGLYIEEPTGASNNWSIYSAGGLNHFVGKVRSDDKFNVNGSDGVSGSFTTADSKTVTVSGGIITSIA